MDIPIILNREVDNDLFDSTCFSFPSIGWFTGIIERVNRGIIIFAYFTWIKRNEKMNRLISFFLFSFETNSKIGSDIEDLLVGERERERAYLKRGLSKQTVARMCRIYISLSLSLYRETFCWIPPSRRSLFRLFSVKIKRANLPFPSPPLRLLILRLSPFLLGNIRRIYRKHLIIFLQKVWDVTRVSQRRFLK